MRITWLGQAGLLLDTGKTRLMIDPYLSDGVEKTNPKMRRRVPADRSFIRTNPDILAFTHDHPDHFDPETAGLMLQRKEKMTVLGPASVWRRVREYGGVHNYVLFDHHTVWTENDLQMTAIRAVHSDPFAVGILVKDLNTRKNYYVAGDTLFNEEIFEDLPSEIEAAFLPINGVGNNMNMTDARAFAKKVNARYTVPMHFGLFDTVNPEEFDCLNMVVPTFYQIIDFGGN